jgi:hypothetical protein
MRRMSAFLIVALTGAFAVSAQAETRAVSWQGQAIEANVGQPTRGLDISREELLRMAREAVPVTSPSPLPKTTHTGQ